MAEAERQVLARERFDEFFSRALDAQARAEALAGGPVRRRFQIADAEVEFRLAHPSLETLFCDALAHIEIAAVGEPDYTFYIWDEVSSGINPPPPCWDRSDLLSFGEITKFIDAERYLHVDLDRAMVGAGNRSLGKAVVWVRSPDHLARVERAAPLPALLNWVANGTGFFTVHAASVGRPDNGALIVGPSGSGKSHTALACLDSELFYVGDDRCFLGTNGPPSSASLYSTARLYAADVHRFPILERNLKDSVQNADGKFVFYLNTIVPERLLSGIPIRAVFLARPSGRRDTTVEPTAAGPALLFLGSDSALRARSLGRDALRNLAAVLRSVPCFRLETGTDISQIPRTIASLLDSLPERTIPVDR